MVDRDKLQMAREAKASRNERGVIDERADICLALYEAGIDGWETGTPTDTLKAWLADPGSAQTRVLPQIPTYGDDGVPRVRRGGEPASNQFGEFEVHNASPKQIAFAKRLLAEKDLTGIKVPKDLDTISKTAASALIDRLLGRPDRATSVGTPSGSVRLASDKQLDYLRNLIAQRDYYSLSVEDRRRVDSVKAGKVPTAKGASALIEVLAATVFTDRPQAQQPKATELEVGMYRKIDGTMYRVYPGRESNRILAKRLVPVDGGGWSFEYAGLATRFVSADERMSLEEAKAWGATFGSCCVCAALLTDPVSVAAGIGPVCASRV